MHDRTEHLDHRLLIVGALVVDQQEDVDVVCLHSEALYDLVGNFHGEESIGKSTSEILVDEACVHRSQRIQFQMLEV